MAGVSLCRFPLCCVASRTHRAECRTAGAVSLFQDDSVVAAAVADRG